MWSFAAGPMSIWRRLARMKFRFSADSTIPGMATGRDATLIASPLVGLPYLIIARKEIKTVQDLRGKTIGVGTVAGLPYQLLKAFVKKFSLEDMQIRPLGGSQPERY